MVKTSREGREQPFRPDTPVRTRGKAKIKRKIARRPEPSKGAKQVQKAIESGVVEKVGEKAKPTYEGGYSPVLKKLFDLEREEWERRKLAKKGLEEGLLERKRKDGEIVYEPKSEDLTEYEQEEIEEILKPLDLVEERKKAAAPSAAGEGPAVGAGAGVERKEEVDKGIIGELKEGDIVGATKETLGQAASGWKKIGKLGLKHTPSPVKKYGPYAATLPFGGASALASIAQYPTEPKKATAHFGYTTGLVDIPEEVPAKMKRKLQRQQSEYGFLPSGPQFVETAKRVEESPKYEGIEEDILARTQAWSAAGLSAPESIVRPATPDLVEAGLSFTPIGTERQKKVDVEFFKKYPSAIAPALASEYLFGKGVSKGLKTVGKVGAKVTPYSEDAMSALGTLGGKIKGGAKKGSYKALTKMLGEEKVEAIARRGGVKATKEITEEVGERGLRSGDEIAEQLSKSGVKTTQKYGGMGLGSATKELIETGGRKTTQETIEETPFAAKVIRKISPKWGQYRFPKGVAKETTEGFFRTGVGEVQETGVKAQTSQLSDELQSMFYPDVDESGKFTYRIGGIGKEEVLKYADEPIWMKKSVAPKRFYAFKTPEGGMSKIITHGEGEDIVKFLEPDEITKGLPQYKIITGEATEEGAKRAGYVMTGEVEQLGGIGIKQEALETGAKQMTRQVPDIAVEYTGRTAPDFSGIGGLISPISRGMISEEEETGRKIPEIALEVEPERGERDEPFIFTREFPDFRERERPIARERAREREKEKVAPKQKYRTEQKERAVPRMALGIGGTGLSAPVPFAFPDREGPPKEPSFDMEEGDISGEIVEFPAGNLLKAFMGEKRPGKKGKTSDLEREFGRLV